MIDIGKINEFQADILKEIGNIGTGNAATALSLMLNGRISIDVPNIRITNADGISQVLGGPENQVAGVLVLMRGDIEGMLLFLLDKNAVSHLLKVLLNENVTCLQDITEMGVSALTEIGNILSGSYINAISQLLDYRITLEAPRIAIDMVGAILNYPASVFGAMKDELMLIEECFYSGQDMFRSNLLIMPEPVSLDRMFSKLGAL
ncbi:MAG: chemotaxis protein CheC [Clostridia bacterium]|jgi:chemotaxis protein CheC